VELASRSVEEKAEQLQLISKYKSEFLANMSHELRTPLNSLLILSKMLADNKDRNLTPEQVKFASTVYSSGNDLLALINEILDLSKIEAGKMPINPKEFDLPEVQDYVERTFRHMAEQKGLDFQIVMDQNLPRTMFTDVNRLQQILKNLLSNAFKFTERGRVVMTVSPVGKEQRIGHGIIPQSGTVVAFAVRDTGIGIPVEKQKLIFEAFQQADGTTSRKYGGTGLGLTISREITRLLGGWLDVVSAPDQGSTFTLYLPQNYNGVELTQPVPVESSTENNAHIPALPEDADFSGAKILVVDDDSRNIFAIDSVLEERKMQVIHAENGKVAISHLQAHPDVDLVLMDMMMPEMDGIEATRIIRQHPRFSRLPIISLTAKAMKGDRDKAIQAGASDYVTKPVDPEKLLSVMYAWLQTKKASVN
jgi:CheY-like chemotaxis protein